MIKKKAEGSAWGAAIVVGLIILLVGVLVFQPLISFVTTFFKSGGGAALCTLSLFEGKGIAKCPIDNVIIHTDRVEIQYGGQDKTEILSEINSGTTQGMGNDALAKLLLTCLNRGGGLNSRAFARDGWFDTNIVCMECAHVTISRGVSEPITGLAGYLNSVQPKGGISDKTYIKLLTKNEEHLGAYLDFGGRASLVPSDETISFEFVPGNDYTVFFIGIKKGSFKSWFNRFKAAVIGNFIEAVVGNSDTYYSYISEPNELGNVCEKKVN
jgi:hypothetical protein